MEDHYCFHFHYHYSFRPQAPIKIEEDNYCYNYHYYYYYYSGGGGRQLFCGGFNPGDGNDAARREPLEHEPFDQEKIRRPLMMIYQFFADLVYRN